MNQNLQYLLHITPFLADHHLFTSFITILIFYPIFDFIFSKFKFSNKKWMFYWQLVSFTIVFLTLTVIFIITYLSFTVVWNSILRLLILNSFYWFTTLSFKFSIVYSYILLYI